MENNKLPTILNDTIAWIIVLAIFGLILLIFFSILSSCIYSETMNHNIDYSKLSIEQHKITDIQKYHSNELSLFELGLWTKIKYPCDSKIKYEITTESGEIIGASMTNLRLNAIYVLYINRNVWNGEEVAWFNDFYMIDVGCD